MRKWLDWILLVVAILLAVSANLPEGMAAQWGIDRKLVIGMLFVLILFGLLRYATVALVVAVVVLSIGANLPAEVGALLGIDTNILLVALSTLAAVALVNKFTNFLPIGLGSEIDIQRRKTEAMLGAIYDANAQEVDNLLRKGVSANVRSTTNRTPLMLATALGSRSIVRLLLRYGADVHAKDNNGLTPLAIAKRRQHREIADDLVKAGALE